MATALDTARAAAGDPGAAELGVVTPLPSPASERGNFDVLRMFAVLIVIYGNGLVLTGAPGSGLWGAPLPRVGLDLLFTIAGYLAIGSRDRAAGIAPFLAGRAGRLFPGLIVCVLVTVFVIGPLATRLPLRAYLLDGMTRHYLSNIFLVQQLWLPRVFEGQQWVGTVNPMLWTLVPGVLCWLIVAALARFSLRAQLWVMGLGAALCASAALVYPAVGPHLPVALFRVSVVEMLVEIPFFLGGAWLALLERRSGESVWRADLAMACFAANWVVATWLGASDIVLEWATLPYMACCFGRMRMPVLGSIGRLGNPSYELYLYAFPIQQLIVERLPGDPHPILTCFLLALAAGYLSWHLIERPVLRSAPALLQSAGRASWRPVA